MNGSLSLLRTALLKRGSRQEVSPQAEEICRLIDHFNDQHWHDRNRYDERIKKLEARVSELERGRP